MICAALGSYTRRVPGFPAANLFVEHLGSELQRRCGAEGERCRLLEQGGTHGGR